MKNLYKKVKKLDGRIMDFNINKIISAIMKADIFNELTKQSIDDLVVSIDEYIYKNDHRDIIGIPYIHMVVEETLKEKGFYNIYKEYSNYRKKRTLERESNSELMKVIDRLGVSTDRDNGNVGNNFSAKLLRIASETNKQYNLSKMPKHLAKLHMNFDAHIHDLDSYNLTPNCLHNDTLSLLKNGFNTGYGFLRPAKRIETAAEQVCILLQGAQNDLFGGQSCVDFDNALGYFVDLSRKEIIEEYSILKSGLNQYKFKDFIKCKLESKVRQAMQCIVYNLNTMHSRAGSQVPFSSLNIGLPDNDDSALVCRILLEEYDKGLGKGEQCIFPNIIFAVKKGVNFDKHDKYFYLFELACDVASRHMNPTFMNIDMSYYKPYVDKGIRPAIMGCRTNLMSNINGEEGPARRGNNAPITMNLPKLGITSNKNIDVFFKSLDDLMELCVESLIHRYNILKKLKVKDLPFVAGQHLMLGSENLNDDDSIEPIIKNGTWGIGFIGLAETLVALTGKHHGESEESRLLGLKIISHIKEFADNKTEEYKMNFSCYASPSEGTSDRFLKNDRERFGIIQGVTDKDFYTNSFHIPVNYSISIKDKLSIEAPYHALCNGGHISYIELDGYPTTETVQKIIQWSYMNTDIDYIGVNFHIRYCKDCGTRIEEQQMKCPMCGSRKIQGISRITGYLALDERFGSGKSAERAMRISHLNGNKVYNNI